MNGINRQSGPGSTSEDVRALIERCDGYRAWTGYSSFKCPCCGSGGLVQFNYSDGASPDVSCVGDCSEAEILASAAQRPARREQSQPPTGATSATAVGRPMSQYARESAAMAAMRTPNGLSADVQRELNRIRARREAESLFDAEQGGDDGPVLSSLTEALPVPDPTILELPDGTCLFRKGWIHWIHGKGGSGKTPVAYLAAIGVISSGGRVLIIDHEMGMDGALDLLRDLAPDLTDEQIDAQVRYLYEKPLHYRRIKEKLLSELDGFTPDLAIVDAVAGSMAEGSQNDNADVNRWFRAVPQWLRDQFGAAVLVIDHSNREDGPMPSGSARKHGAPEFRLWVRLVRDFNPDHEDGCSLLEVRKERGRHARTGKVVAELRTVMGGSFELRAVDRPSVRSGDEVEVDLGALPYAHQVRIDVHDALRQAGAEGVTKTKVTDLSPRGDGGGANAKARREQLDWLEKHGQAVWRREPGTSRGERWWAVEFFPGDSDE